LKSTSIKIVSQQWIEDSLSCNSHPYPPESDYSLRDGSVLEEAEEEEELLGTTSMQVLDQDMESAAARPEGLKKGFLRRGRARKAQGEQTVIKSTPTPTKMKESNNTVKKRGLRRGEREVKGEGGSSSESGEIVPRRRLKLDAASKQSGKARLAPKLAPRPNSIRVAQRRLLERYDHPRYALVQCLQPSTLDCFLCVMGQSMCLFLDM
jgi:hypothetical protein